MKFQQCASNCNLLFDSLPVKICESKSSLCSDGGLALVAHLDRALGVSKGLAQSLTDCRQASKVRHSIEAMVRQRTLGFLAGWEDANDHDQLRHNLGWQAMVGGDAKRLAAQPTLSRFENTPKWHDIEAMQHAVLEFGMQQMACAWKGRVSSDMLTLDIDSTDDPCHGRQQLSLFHGYYKQNQLQMLAISEPQSKALLSMHLLAGTHTPWKGAMVDIKRVCESLRDKLPNTPIHLRGDSGFACGAFFDELDEAGVGYTMRIARNDRLKAQVQTLVDAVTQISLERVEPQDPSYSFFSYKADSWRKERTVVFRIQAVKGDVNVCFVVTTQAVADGTQAREVFEYYAKRCAFEQRFDELKNELHADRLSCHRYRANYLRMVMHTMAYGMVNMLRMLEGVPETMRSWRVKSWICRLFKSAVRVRKSTRCLWLEYDPDWPSWKMFQQMCRAVKNFKCANWLSIKVAPG